jgi:hypothetical protein
MSKILPTPTQRDIEAALMTMRDGTSAYGRLACLDQRMEAYHQWVAEADRLWWVTIIDPEGTEQAAVGGGTTPAEAAAVGWINTYLLAWWDKPCLSDEDYAKVPRNVPEGWQFELHAAPVRRPPVLKVIQDSLDPMVSGGERSPWSDGH